MLPSSTLTMVPLISTPLEKSRKSWNFDIFRYDFGNKVVIFCEMMTVCLNYKYKFGHTLLTSLHQKMPEMQSW